MQFRKKGILYGNKKRVYFKGHKKVFFPQVYSFVWNVLNVLYI